MKYQYYTGTRYHNSEVLVLRLHPRGNLECYDKQVGEWTTFGMNPWSTTELISEEEAMRYLALESI